MPGLNSKGWIYLFISVTLWHLHLHAERKYILDGFLNQLWMHFSSSCAEDRSVLLRKTMGAGVWHSTRPPLQPALTLVNVNMTREETLPLLWLIAPFCNSFSTRIFLLCSGSLVPLQIIYLPSYIILQRKAVAACCLMAGRNTSYAKHTSESSKIQLVSVLDGAQD